MNNIIYFLNIIMGMLDDMAIFASVVEHQSFSRAAKQLHLSNGLISRRIAQLEKNLGVCLIKRTTRQLQLTQEGEICWQHAKRINQELNTALSLVQSSTAQPKGNIKISAPPHLGRHYLMPIIMKFLTHFKQITVDLILDNSQLDLIKNQLDLVIRGSGYLERKPMADSNLKMKWLLTEPIQLYASRGYLTNHGEPKSINELNNHSIINYAEPKWIYQEDNYRKVIQVQPKLNVNDIESSIMACVDGYGIGKFTHFNVKNHLNRLQPILTQYDWGHYSLYALYPNQEALPTRTRVLLDFIDSHLI